MTTALATFDVENYLAYFGFPKPKRSGDNWMTSCPDFWGLHKHGDAHYSFGIQAHPPYLANCFVCGGWTLEQLTALLLSRKRGFTVTPVEAAEWLEQHYHLSAPMPGQLPDLQFPTWEELRGKRHELPVIPESVLAPYQGRVHRSVVEGQTRRLSIDTCKAWGIGYDAASRRTVIPVRRPDGGLVGVISRATSPSDPYRYLIGLPNRDPATGKVDPSKPVILDFPRQYLLFGEHAVKGLERVVVVETALDVIYAHDQGWTDSFDFVALNGAKGSAHQVARLVRWPVVVLALDSDEAGRAGMGQLRVQLQRRTSLLWADWARVGKKDLGDCTPEEAVRVLSDLRPISDL